MTQEKKFKLTEKEQKEFNNFIQPLLKAYKKEIKKNEN